MKIQICRKKIDNKLFYNSFINWNKYIAIPLNKVIGKTNNII